jgi:hypothetical protein
MGDGEEYIEDEEDMECEGNECGSSEEYPENHHYQQNPQYDYMVDTDDEDSLHHEQQMPQTDSITADHYFQKLQS